MNIINFDFYLIAQGKVILEFFNDNEEQLVANKIFFLIVLYN